MLSKPAELRVELQHKVGTLALDVHFLVHAPWTVLFGPSGSGKTTVLRAIAGFVVPDAGQITMKSAGSEHALFDGARRLAVPPHQRPIRTAGQRAQMFPRRTVRENVCYGADRRTDDIDEVLRMLHLTDLGSSSVERLSGGEQQRVSVARAIAAARVAGPGTWLLLDEPFTGLDLSLRDALTTELRPWLEHLGHPVLSVTHDVAEVFALKAEVVRLSNGRVVATGPAGEVLARDRARLLSDLQR